MKQRTEIIMGMPITAAIVQAPRDSELTPVFDLFRRVDERYSPYKPDSELSRINKGLPEHKWSKEMKNIFDLCEETKKQTNGYFDIKQNGKIDPSGLVKGWAIQEAATLLKSHGYQNFYIEAGGDIHVSGHNDSGDPWTVGIRNPSNIQEIVKVLHIHNRGVATSGTYIRGEHIYNPHNPGQKSNQIKSMTVIGPNIYEADCFATAAFAMGPSGISFIEQLPGLDAYMIDDRGIATYTKGFEDYVV